MRAAPDEAPRPSAPFLVSEFDHVNDRGRAAGMTARLDPNTGFRQGKPVTWQTGWPRVLPLGPSGYVERITRRCAA
jgi:hypothetical protein